MGLDLDSLINLLLASNLLVLKKDFSLLTKEANALEEGTPIFYTASYNVSYNQYIKDVVLNLHFDRPDLILIPNVDLLFSFENKGYQELYKKRLGIEEVNGAYYGDIDDLSKKSLSITFPVVVKTPSGAMSSGVHLINNMLELKEFARKYKKRTFLEYLRHEKRKLVKKRKDHLLKISEDKIGNNFENFFSKRMPFVVQEFVPDLCFDYKILIFGNKYYVLKRLVRNDDFRASGSGKFEWVEPSMALLKYSNHIFEKMRTPFVALDVYENQGKYGLIEFQGIGFGPLTLVGSSFYYIKQGHNWRKIDKTSNLEEEYANALKWFLKNEDC